MNFINSFYNRTKKFHFSLIDPEDQMPKEAGRKAKLCENYGTDAIMVGGSTIHKIPKQKIYDTIDEIKKSVKIPTILFPNSADSITENLEYIFFMSLVNSKDDRFITGEQEKGKILIEKYKIKPISMAYMIVSTSKEPTTVERMVTLDKIFENDMEKAAEYAVRAEKAGFKSIYLEAGSGAEKPVPDEMISRVREKIDIAIVVGGGLRDAKAVKAKIAAGADAVVNGTLIEEDKNLNKLRAIIRAVKN